jgi:methylated-DNA-[protein]-cysteine S-methyltransferase
VIFTCTIDTPLGAVTAAAEDEAVTGLWFVGQKHYPEPAGWIPKPDYPVFDGLRVWLAAYFAGARLQADIRLNSRGTAFQKKVWELLLDIPYGEVNTYGGIAQELTRRSGGRQCASARAVGGAVGHNPISILIPCHRVVGFGGNLTGYAGGLERKKALLRLEGWSGGARSGTRERVFGIR